MIRYIYFLLVILAISACIAPITTESLKPEGDQATINVKNSGNQTVELLAISDSNLYVLNKNKIHLISINDLRRIQIYGYDVETGTKIMGALPALALETIILLVAISEEQSTWAGIAALSMVGTTALWVAGGPKQNYTAPFSQSDIKQLQLYCRYPQGLPENRWAELLQFHHQDEFYSLQ
jgi:hypothetical protein